jgi:hypothetical protein
MTISTATASSSCSDTTQLHTSPILLGSNVRVRRSIISLPPAECPTHKLPIPPSCPFLDDHIATFTPPNGGERFNRTSSKIRQNMKPLQSCRPMPPPKRIQALIEYLVLKSDCVLAFRRLPALIIAIGITKTLPRVAWRRTSSDVWIVVLMFQSLLHVFDLSP